MSWKVGESNDIPAMKTMITSLDKDFQTELAAKQAVIDSTYAQLRQTSKTLADLRRQLEHSRRQVNKLNEIQQRCRNIKRAIEVEDADFHGYGFPEMPQQYHDGNISADAPFIVGSDDYHTPAHVLQARVSAYQRNEQVLVSLAESLKDKSSELESKCRRVVSLCTNVEESQVDSLLEGLLQAVESDGDQSEFDINRVAGFLKIVACRT